MSKMLYDFSISMGALSENKTKITSGVVSTGSFGSKLLGSVFPFIQTHYGHDEYWMMIALLSEDAIINLSR